YFPVNPLLHAVYDLKDQTYGYLDTVGCFVFNLQGQPVFCFPNLGYPKYPSPDIAYTSFGQGVFFYRNDSLFTLEASFVDQIREKQIRDARLILPARMSPGDSIRLDLGMNKQVYTYLYKEDVTIKGRIYKDCIKIKMIEYWPETIYLGYIWLGNQIGVVKWMRTTGRTDELVNQY
ncbi:MAG TPA: hypothetical protein VNZ86_11065, partial [Bacteroidia bacterium]|nr:hypothetical protein [Bacteroidia bacterium]